MPKLLPQLVYRSWLTKIGQMTNQICWERHERKTEHTTMPFIETTFFQLFCTFGSCYRLLSWAPMSTAISPWIHQFSGQLIFFGKGYPGANILRTWIYQDSFGSLSSSTFSPHSENPFPFPGSQIFLGHNPYVLSLVFSCPMRLLAKPCGQQYVGQYCARQ